MSKLSDELDPRLIVLPIEAVHQDRGESDPVNGVLILSKVGLHFYGQEFVSRSRKFVDVAPEHVPLPDVQVSTGSWSTKTLIKATVYLALGQVDRTYTVGYTKAIGRGDFGRLFAGIGNASKHLSTGETRSGFIAAVEQMKRQRPSLPVASRTNPHLVRLRYFIDASALGPAIDAADKALRYAEAQSIITKGPSFSERYTLKKEGYNKSASQFPPLSTSEVTIVKRQRAWLLIDGQRFTTLIEESQKQLDRDAEVTLAYGIAHMLNGAKEKALPFFQRAKTLEADNVKVRAGIAWGLALQQKSADARTEISAVQSAAHNDRHALLLLGCAKEALGERAAALDDYFASAALAHGYFEGAVACQRALSLANTMDAATGLNIAKKLTQVLPEQREAWEGLVVAARRVSNHELAGQAQEHVTLMHGTLL
jgi:tetratricopeptide (TPR) repeat protein